MLTTRILLKSLKICQNNQNLQKIYQTGAIFSRKYEEPILLTQQHKFISTENNNDKNNIKIYYGSLAPRMKAVKIFSLTTSFAGLAAQPILMEQGVKIGGTGMAIFLCSIAGFFTFVTPLLLHFITKKYVTEMHYNELTDEYTATTISIILRKLQTKFKISDVTVPEIPGMFTSISVGNKAFFVDPTQFIEPDHYVKIMGYDKPIDFKLDLSESESHETIVNDKNMKKSI